MEVFIIASLTADGFIAKQRDHLSLDWTSLEDKKFFMRRTIKSGMMVMGANSFATITKPLPLRDRKIVVYTRDLTRFEHITPEQAQITQLPPAELLKSLEKEGYSSVAICGGSSIYTMFLKAGLVDRIFLTIEPILFGEGIKLFDESFETKLSLNKVHQLSEQTVVLDYTVIK
jgi:dihydrofolate reductase